MDITLIYFNIIIGLGDQFSIPFLFLAKVKTAFDLAAFSPE